MRRTVAFLLPALVLLVAGVLAAEDRKDKRGEDAPRPKEDTRTGKRVPFFDAAEFIKEYDRNKDGYLSKDELPGQFRHNFDKLDANKDGKLSQEELQKGFTHLQPPRRPSDFVFVLVEMSDCDECCAEELQVVYEFLRKLDKNGNGKIDADELKAGRGDLVQKRVDSIFAELDTNKDGKLSRDEARGQVKAHFNDLDTDRDGFISREELMKAALEKPGAAGKGAIRKTSGATAPEK